MLKKLIAIAFAAFMVVPAFAASEERILFESTKDGNWEQFLSNLAKVEVGGVKGYDPETKTVLSAGVLVWVCQNQASAWKQSCTDLPTRYQALKVRNSWGETIPAADLKAQGQGGGVFFPHLVTAAQAPVVTPAPAATAPAADPKLVYMSAEVVGEWVAAAKLSQENSGSIATQTRLINNLNGEIGQLKEQLKKANSSPANAALVRDLQMQVKELQGGKGNFATKEQLEKLQQTIAGLEGSGSKFETQITRSIRELLRQEAERSKAAQAAVDLKLGSFAAKQLAMEQKVDGLTEATAGSKGPYVAVWAAIVLVGGLALWGWIHIRSRVNQQSAEVANVTSTASSAGKVAAEEVLHGFEDSQKKWRKKTVEEIQGMLDGQSAKMNTAFGPLANRVTAVEQGVAELKGRRHVEFVDVDIRRVVGSLAKAGSRSIVRVKTPEDGMEYQVFVRRETDAPDSTYELIGVCGDARSLVGDDPKMLHSVTGVKKQKVESTIYRAAAIDSKVGKCRLTIPVVEREPLKVVPTLDDIVDTQPADLAVA